jgi:hypothetical protein
MPARDVMGKDIVRAKRAARASAATSLAEHFERMPAHPLCAARQTLGVDAVQRLNARWKARGSENASR